MPDERKEPGDRIRWSAEEWNRWVNSASELFPRASLGSPVGVGSSAIQDHTPRSFAARLSGASSPYGWQEVVRDLATETWVDGSRSGTASAIEINGVSGLANTIQWVTECGPGEWCFQAVKVGAALPCGVLAFVVRGCHNQFLAGVSITVYDGPTQSDPVLIAGTTDSRGRMSAPFSTAKTYAWKATTPSTRFAVASGTVAATCTTVSVPVTLTASAGFICCPVPDPACNATLGICAAAYPNRLYLTNGLFTAIPLDYHTVTTLGSPCFGWWQGCSPWTGAGLTRDAYGYGNCLAANVTASIVYRLFCAYEPCAAQNQIGSKDLAMDPLAISSPNCQGRWFLFERWTSCSTFPFPNPADPNYYLPTDHACPDPFAEDFLSLLVPNYGLAPASSPGPNNPCGMPLSLQFDTWYAAGEFGHPGSTDGTHSFTPKHTGNRVMVVTEV